MVTLFAIIGAEGVHPDNAVFLQPHRTVRHGTEGLPGIGDDDAEAVGKKPDHAAGKMMIERIQRIVQRVGLRESTKDPHIGSLMASQIRAMSIRIVICWRGI